MIPLATWAKAWVCSHSLAATAGLSPAGSMLCVIKQRFLRRADQSSREFVRTVLFN